MKSFLLIKTIPGSEKSVMEALKEMPEVTEAHLITGKFDLLVTLNTGADTTNLNPRRDVTKMVVSNVRTLKGVIDTRTIFPIDSKHSETVSPVRSAVKGFVFIDCVAGKARGVMNSMLGIPGVHGAHLIFGKDDLLAEIEVENSFVAPPASRIYRLVESSIAKLPGVRDTDTIVPVESFRR